MPIEGIRQPAIIQIDEALRLRKYDGNHAFAFSWYQDPEVVYLVDGVREPYDRAKLDRMYHYLDTHGELYFIERLCHGEYMPIGDVTFSKEDLPIVIGENQCRGQGIGKKVIHALIDRARTLGYDKLTVQDIYDYNTASRKMFESLGFKPASKTKNGHSYLLKIS